VKRLFIGYCLVVVGILAMGADASARIRVGGGVGIFAELIVPVGRVSVDLLSLGFAKLAIEAEYWYISESSQWLFPFGTFYLPVILAPSVGAGPIFAISDQRLSLVEIGFALKGGIGLSLGRWGLFGEGILFVSPQYGVGQVPFFTVGLNLNF
jgi:hypothetical protein